MILTVILLSCHSKLDKFKDYKIARPNYWDSFLTLSEIEAKSIEHEKEFNDRQDYLFKVDSMFIPGTPDSLKLRYSNKAVERRRNFEFNRSRWNVDTYVNNAKVDSTLHENEFITFFCGCTLEENKIKVNMGIWVFGGMFVDIHLSENTYSAFYTENVHEESPYKYSPQDSSFTDEINSNLVDKKLTLLSEPRFTINERVAGLIEFETPKFYSTAGYKKWFYGKSKTELDELFIKGEVYFSCVLKNKKFN